MAVEWAFQTVILPHLPAHRYQKYVRRPRSVFAV